MASEKWKIFFVGKDDEVTCEIDSVPGFTAKDLTDDGCEQPISYTIERGTQTYYVCSTHKDALKEAGLAA